eukprot:2807558-Rhodomonas_salina.2
MHNYQLHRLTYRPTPTDLARTIRKHYSDPSRRYFTLLQVLPTPPPLFSGTNDVDCAACGTDGGCKT